MQPFYNHFKFGFPMHCGLFVRGLFTLWFFFHDGPYKATPHVLNSSHFCFKRVNWLKLAGTSFVTISSEEQWGVGAGDSLQTFSQIASDRVTSDRFFFFGSEINLIKYYYF